MMRTISSDILGTMLIGTILWTFLVAIATANQRDDFQTLVSSYESWRLDNSPEYSRLSGRPGYNDVVDDYSIRVLEERHQHGQGLLQKLSNIDPLQLLKHERDDYAILKSTLELYIDGHKWKNYGAMNPVSNMEGLWNNPEYAIPSDPRTFKDFDDYIKRIEGYGNQTVDFIARMRQAIQFKTTNHWLSMEKVTGVIEDLIGMSEEDCIMYEPFKTKLEMSNLSRQTRTNLRNRAVVAIDGFRNKYTLLKTFIEGEYKAATRQAYGVRSFPDGAEFYRACLRWHLTTDLTPEEIHSRGLKEVTRIRGEMQTVMDREGFPGTIQEFFQSLNDSNFILNSSEAVFDEFVHIVEDRVWPKLHKIFKNVPNLPVIIRPMPYDGLMGTYSSGGSKNGYFNINIFRPADSPTYSMMALSLHEADPGHHLQDIYSKVTTDIPKFRKLVTSSDYFSIPLNFPFFTAYIEGWGLYAESLGEAEYLDVYQDDFELMGRYSFEIFRACRLVVDTGIHYYNWSRDDAIEYVLNYTSLTRDVVTTEVDRYITWPGQACAYKIGEMKIKELREKAKSQLGAEFDIKDFHYLLLSNGPVPLDIMEKMVDDWIQEKQDTLEKIMADYFDWRNKNSPEFSTFSTHKYNDRVAEYGLDQLERLWVGATDFRDRLDRIARSTITDNSKQLSYDVLENMLDTFIAGYEWKSYGALNPIHFLSGLWTDPSGVWSSMPFDTQGDFINYVRRLEQTPRQLEQLMNITREAIALGHTSHNASLFRIPGDIDRVLTKTTPEDTDFYKPFTEHAEKLFPELGNRDYIEDRLKAAINSTLDKLKELKEFIVNDYIPFSRPGLGVGSLPRGRDLYRAALRWHTDLDITPEEVHQTGLEEVDRIVKLMRKLMTEIGFPSSMSIGDVYKNMTADPKFLLANGDEILKRYREVIFERIQPVLPQYFRDIPELPLVVQGMVVDGIGGSYMGGKADGSLPGVFFANVLRPSDNPTFAMISLSLHEALPGHHLQNSYSVTSDLPDFRKYLPWSSYDVPYFFPFYNAYTEGWALYCEYLGEEMGIYQDNYEMLGRYSDEMLRAARLVIDTGIHYFNMSREEAIQYLLDHTAMTPEACATAIDRYATWPGQATGYKMGEIKIKQLRQKAKEQLGPRFDIRDFHYQILANGALPLDILETVIDTWIGSFEAAPSTLVCDNSPSGTYRISVSYLLLIITAVCVKVNIVL